MPHSSARSFNFLFLKFIAIISAYQDAKAAARLLQNLDSMEIPSIWYDGRVEGFPRINNSDTSTDGLLELILSYKRTHTMTGGPGPVGHGTNKMMKLAAQLNYDYTLLLSCDEYLEGDVELFESNLEKIKLSQPTKMRLPFVEHNIKGNKDNNGGKHIAERLVYLPGFVKIKDIHWLYYHNYFGYDMMMDRPGPLILGLTIHHDDTIRDPARNTMMDEFQKTQKKREMQRLVEILQYE
jgi:hypothetical protein